jgi:hypothetical protein
MTPMVHEYSDLCFTDNLSTSMEEDIKIVGGYGGGILGGHGGLRQQRKWKKQMIRGAALAFGLTTLDHNELRPAPFHSNNAIPPLIRLRISHPPPTVDPLPIRRP